MDVFIIEKHRTKGYSKILLDEILKHPELSKIEKWLLATTDAHNLYQQFQFVEIIKPGKYMERVKLS
ncbi:MAG TPA: GNAT family N-acetyltransferase [Arachidicoccus sp.]